ncbi:MAG: hypothetical protein JXR73_18910 [Candidatus Omnitrophica bacterium]|nr:hypothetical protein [Candidatus Omnitrophota bacterium]
MKSISIRKILIYTWIMIGIGILCGAASADPEMITDASKTTDLSNSWIRTEIDADHGGLLNQFTAHQGSFLKPSLKNKSQMGRSSLFSLYKQHPLESKEAIELPEEFKSKVIREASSTLVQIQSATPSQISLFREYRMAEIESAFTVKTTIQNKDESSLTFYPTEIICFDASLRNAKVPNTLAYFYSPYQPDKKTDKGFAVIRGATDKTQFNQMSDDKIFIARYMLKTGEVKLTSDQNWLAFQNLLGQGNIKGGTVCALEYEFPDKKPETIQDNLLVYVNGMDRSLVEFPVNASDRVLKEKRLADPHIRITYVLGKVQLAPGESFVYSTRWTAACCQGPVTDVRDGLIYNKHLEVLASPSDGSFLNFANLGVPQEGKIGFHYYDKKGRMRTIIDSEGVERPLLLVTPISHPYRASEVVPFLATELYPLRTWILNPEDLRNENDTYAKLIEDEIGSIQMVLVDENRNVIRELDRCNAPFKIYQEPNGGEEKKVHDKKEAGS